MSFYFTTMRCYNGGYEYGLYTRLYDGHLIFYEESNANEAGAQSYGVDLTGQYGIYPFFIEYYGVFVQPSGEFTVEVDQGIPCNPCEQVLFKQSFPQASFMPNMYNATGWLTSGIVQSSTINNDAQFGVGAVFVGQ
jgi:hypothetical protein